MVDKRVIYNNADGQLAILVPAPDCGLTIEEIALKDVPYGLPFKIVGLTDLPADRAQRLGWTVDDKDLTDGVGADYGVGSENPFIMPETAQ